MEDESSNDVIAMDSEESQTTIMPAIVEENELAGRPLMQFFKRLIFNKHSQNTMLTNAQLEDILNTEFSIDLLSLHKLEVEIYVTILKKYLKEWPQWDEFETTTKELSENYEPNIFVNVLKTRYVSLKNYLKGNLEMAKELSVDLVSKVKKLETSKQKSSPAVGYSKKPSSSDVVLEIKATREQLNRLIYRQPHAEFNNTIFNVEDKAPSQITLNTLSLEAILNWWSVRITVSLQANTVFMTRETIHELEHLLVNCHGKCAYKETMLCPIISLNQDIQVKEMKKVKRISKRLILGCLELLSTKHDAEMEGMETIIQCLIKDLTSMHVIGAPAQYRRYLCKYPYVRYLFSEPECGNKSNNASYDIQLKETIFPMHQFSVGRMDADLEGALPPQWLKVECIVCNIAFSGENLATELKQHFDEYHHSEPDWQCTHCQKSFSMAKLAESWWNHKCQEETGNNE